MHSEILRAEHLQRSFGKVTAVRDASLSLRPGRVTGLVGPNGSGKTTLLLMLATLLRPDAGSLTVGSSLAEARQLIGWMPDQLGAWPALTVRETLEYTAKLFDLHKAAAAERATELISVFELQAIADQPAKVLSRGQKQRLGLARALVHRPRILLLDEPAAGLDPDARIHLRELLREYVADGGAVLISSHVLSDLDDVADDAVFMFQGVTADSPRDCGAEPRSWRLKTLGGGLTPAALAAVLSDPPARPPRITADRDHLLLELTGEAEAAQVLRALIAADVPVTEFAPEYGELEHRFMSLHTRKP